MWENFVFLVKFDTCDVLYNWSISLLPHIVLDNLFVSNSVKILLLTSFKLEKLNLKWLSQKYT